MGEKKTHFLQFRQAVKQVTAIHCWVKVKTANLGDTYVVWQVAMKNYF